MIAARLRLGWWVLVLASPSALGAQDKQDSLRVDIEAFADIYYAYDFGRPANLDRRFTTTAARHGEMNVNLAYLGANVTSSRVRARIALQFGTSVQVNYATEPRLGSVSGPEVSRFVQEAFIGYCVRPTLWVDAGIYLAPFGSESWISSDNWTYTRSLIADFSPYYAAGIRSVWQATPTLQAQIHVMNGWQNISESNGSKAVAVRFDYAPTDRISVAYDAFFGNEQPDSSRAARRMFQEVITRFRVRDGVELSATADFGAQQATSDNLSARWSGWAVLARYRVAAPIWLAGRVEAFSDPRHVVATTGSPSGLRASGTSVTVDIAPEPHLRWRLELRELRATDRVFESNRASDRLSLRNVVLATAISVRLP